MREIACDVAIIGAGSAGIAAYRAAREAGAEPLLIERGPGGTTCARVGCMPSKLLIAAACAARAAREADRFGIRVERVGVDGRAVMERVRRMRDGFVASVFGTLDEFPPESRLSGHAVFEAPDALLVDDATRVRFRAAIVATGSSPSVPGPLQGLGERLLTTDTLFEIAELPDSIAVLGAGPVGLELAQALAWLDVRTALFDQAASLGGLSDPDLLEQARAAFGGSMSLHLCSEVSAAEAAGTGARLRWSGAEDGQDVFARVLAAAGRPPNLRGIGLDHAGLTLDDDGLPAFDRHSLVCEGAPIVIAGDANGMRPILHEASRQGALAGRNAAALARGDAQAIEAPRPTTPLAIVFTHPQIALVGESGPTDGTECVSGWVDFRDQGRAKADGQNVGGLRVHADPRGKLLGAQMLGPEVEHLAHLLAFAIEDGRTAQELIERPFYHPTIEEGFKMALADIVRQVR